MEYLIPGISGTVETDGGPTVAQAAPLLNCYSPRLFGSPPQLTSLNDIRSMSASGGSEGPVGDFYLENILRDAQVANFVVGRAMFTGGMSSIANAIRVAGQYKHALSKYGNAIVNSDGTPVGNGGAVENIVQESNEQDTFESNMGNTTASMVLSQFATGTWNPLDEVDADTVVSTETQSIAATIDSGGFLSQFGAFKGAFVTSLSVQQPFYTFASDWLTYIENVKMMVNAATIMLGLSDASVRIGDELMSISPNQKINAENDVWANYRYITPTSGSLGAAQELDSQNGSTLQYVSFMVDPKGVSESYDNQVGASKLESSVINMGNEWGNEIAFITSTTASGLDDAILNIADDAVSVAEGIMSQLGTGGRFTASIASSMFRSFKGDHNIYPQIFTGHSSNASAMSLTVKLRASGGDAYSYLTEILVPMFFALAMVLPKMSKNSGASYSYPPIVQCNIPGVWGTRLGMVTGLSITKNPDGTDVSIYGYPTAVDMTISVTDLQHTLMTSPMNKASIMLNNHSMFDYIAQCCGVDKYRMNGSMRLVTKALLAASATSNVKYNLTNALKSDFYDWANRFLGTGRM